MFQHKLSLTKTYATSLAFLKFVCNMFNKFSIMYMFTLLSLINSLSCTCLQCYL